MTINHGFGITVRTLRDQRGWSQEKFSEIVGIHRTYVSSIELGKVSVSLIIAEKIAKSFGLPLSKLFQHAEKHRANREGDIQLRRRALNAKK